MLGVQYHTAYIFTQKIREALLAEQEALPKLEGEVEVDGAFFGGHIERFNFRDRRTGHIHCRRRYGERRVVVVARQRGGRTLTTVVAKESEAFPFIVERVAAASTIHADLGHGWDGLQRLYEMMRIGHHEGFSLRGAYTNQAESFFAMLRRKQMGVHHRMSGEHLRLYAAEMAWRMDHKHLSGSELAILVLRLLLTQAPTGQFVNFFSNTRLPA